LNTTLGSYSSDKQEKRNKGVNSTLNAIMPSSLLYSMASYIYESPYKLKIISKSMAYTSK